MVGRIRTILSHGIGIPCLTSLPKRRRNYVSSVCVAEKLLATDHTRNAARVVSAVNSLHLMHAYLGQEDGSLDNRLVAAINVAADAIAGDGLSGHGDNDVYPTVGTESQKLFTLSTTELFTLSTSEKRSTLMPEALSRQWGVDLDTAKRMLQVTTQSGIQYVLAPGENMRSL